MFYNAEILTRAKGGISIFWLAGTLGKGGAGGKKLTKAEILKSNVVKACEKVIAPEEPLALRLSATLLQGIARVYQQQYLFHATEVTHVHQNLKKAVFEATMALPDITLAADIPFPDDEVAQPVLVVKQAAHAGGIDLPINKSIAILGFNPDLIDDRDWSFPGDRSDKEASLDLGEEEGFLSPAAAGTREGTPLIARQPTGAHQAREADITLHEPQLDDYLLQRDVGGEDLFGAAYFGDNQPVFGDGDQGLLEGVFPEMDAATRAASPGGHVSAAGSGRGSAPCWGASSSAIGLPLDMGGYDDNFANQEYGGGFEDYGQGYHQGFGAEDLQDRVRGEHEEARARLEGVAGARRSPTPLAYYDVSRDFIEGETPPSSVTRKRVSDALEQAQAKAAQTQKDTSTKSRPAKKAKGVPFDPETELSDDAFRNMRLSYGDRMAAERAKAEKAKNEKEAHKKAMDLVFGIPPMFQAPELQEFWKTYVIDSMAPFDGGKADPKKRRITGPTPPKKKGKTDDVEPEDSRAAIGRLSEQPQGQEEVRDLFGAGMEEYGGGFDQVELGLGADMGGFDAGYQFDQDVEQGRAASEAGLTGSQRPSMLPWTQEAATSDAGAPLAGFGGPSSQPGGSRVSLDTPLHRDPLHGSRAGSLRPSILGSSPHRAGSVGLLAEKERDFGGFEGHAFSRSRSPSFVGSASAAGQPDPTGATFLDSESIKFLNYCRRQRAALPVLTTDDTEESQLFFSDIVPVASTNASTAAQAMYHLLCLATKGMVKVQQDEAYGEIGVDIVEVQ